MADIYLIWYRFPDVEIPATREELRRWLVELSLPAGPLSRTSRGRSFSLACGAAVTTYEDADGRERTLRGHRRAKTMHLVSFEVRRDDGTKMAQLQYFPPRRTALGMVAGSDTFSRMLRPDLDLHERVGVSEWLNAAQARAERQKTKVNPRNVRHLARLSFDAVATPILGRRTMYFAYGDHRDVLLRIKDLLLRCCPDGYVSVVGIEAGSDLSQLVDSADRMLAHTIDQRRATMNAYLVNPRRRSQPVTTWSSWGREIDAFVAAIDRHELYLGDTLEAARAALTDINEIRDLAPPTGDLL